MSAPVDLDAVERAASSFAKYHAEHAGLGGLSCEFHAMAESFLGAKVPELIAEIRLLRAEAARIRKRESAQIEYGIGLQRLIETLARGEMPASDGTHMSRVAAKAATKLAEAKRLGLEACHIARADRDDATEVDVARIAAALEAL